MKRLSIVFCTLLIALAACSEDGRYVYEATSDNWEVTYVTVVSGQSDLQTSGSINYVGEEPAPNRINYVIESERNKVEVEETLFDERAELGTEFCSGCAVSPEEEQVKVEIKWRDKSETLILTNQ